MEIVITRIKHFSRFNLAVKPQSNSRHRCDRTYLLKVRWRLWWRGRWQEPQWRFGKLVIQKASKGVEGDGEKLFFSSLRSPAENERGEKVRSSQQELRRRRRRRCLTVHTNRGPSMRGPLPATPTKSTRECNTHFRHNFFKKEYIKKKKN